MVTKIVVVVDVAVVVELPGGGGGATVVGPSGPYTVTVLEDWAQARGERARVRPRSGSRILGGIQACDGGEKVSWVWREGLRICHLRNADGPRYGSHQLSTAGSGRPVGDTALAR